MLDLFSRWVLHLEVQITSHPPEAPNLWLADELDHLFAAHETGQAVQLIANETAAIRIRDIEIDRANEILFVLFNYADKNATDPVFENLETGDLRTEPKLDGEGVAVSAHMAIDLRPSEVGMPSYRALLEDAPGIGRSKIEPFLTYLYRMGHRIQWEAPDGSVKNCRPLFDITGRASDTLRNDLREGRLSMIELVQHRPEGDGFDEEGAVIEEVRTIKLSVAPNSVGDAAMELINRVRGRGQAMGYPNMKIRWTHGRQKSAEFGTAREDAGDVLVYKTTKITSEDPLSQCDELIRENSRTALREIILEERGQA